MSAWKELGMPILASALIYLIILRVAGELHPSSNALHFFFYLWIVQSDDARAGLASATGSSLHRRSSS
jgi:hypothetical protein